MAVATYNENSVELTKRTLEELCGAVTSVSASGGWFSAATIAAKSGLGVSTTQGCLRILHSRGAVTSRTRRGKKMSGVGGYDWKMNGS